jgi:hypothetical protein
MRTLILLALLTACADGKGTDTDIDTDTDPALSGEDRDDDGVSELDGDCDDDDDARFPGNTELCNSIDDDCDLLIDNDAEDARTWYLDDDGDLFGDDEESVIACRQLVGYSTSGEDCDDDDETVHPGAVESCDGDDEDCDGEVDDDAIDAGTFRVDDDGDGYGDDAVTVRACGVGPGVVDNAADCDDGDELINPDAPELCNGLDDDCNDVRDDDPGFTLVSFFRDADGDGVGVGASSAQACAAPPGFVATLGDCNDGDAAVSPEADEVACDGRDNDCDPTPPVAVQARRAGALVADLATAIAGASAGQEIGLCEGVYTIDELALTVDGLVLRGNGGSVPTVVLGSGDGALFTVGDGLSAQLHSLTLKEGIGHLDGDTRRGGALYLGLGSSVSLNAVAIEDNTAECGGGVAMEPGSTLTGDGSIRDNHSSGDGGGLCLDGDNSLNGLWIADNAADGDGGGLYADGSLALTDVDFEANEADGVAGALVASGTVTMLRVDIEGHSAGGSPSTVWLFAADTTMTACLVDDNGHTGGSTVVVEGGTLTSTGTNWGSGPGDNDDAEVELVIAGQTYVFEGPRTFSCTDEVGGTCQ